MIINNEILVKIRNFGALQYPPERICTLLKLSVIDRGILLIEFSNPNSEISIYYNQGREIGNYNIDAELHKQAEKGDVDSIIQLSDRQTTQRINHLKKELFGI